jgi:hypothetical protein
MVAPCALRMDPGALPFSENGDERILGQLAVLIVFICGTELLDDAGNTVVSRYRHRASHTSPPW